MSFLLKLFSRFYKKTKKVANIVVDNILPFIRTQNYLGYKLYYSKGTSLIEMIDKRTSIYEPDTCKVLTELLTGIESPAFIDIGSNIGLISLYMLKHTPKIKIYAFDPGPHQTKLFRKTILKNKLLDEIDLYEIALSDDNCDTDFFIHNTKDSSADGFRDTGLAGNSKLITVKACRLDDWWIRKNKPHIDLLKIDTEGAELFVLKGATILFEECKPKVYFEMHPSLYSKYHYSHQEILNFFDSKGYIVYSLNSQTVNKNNIEMFLAKYANYYALPEK